MYSQHGEDELILKHVPATGRFLDIGAFWPKDLSNTRLLYERGWSGVMIEPSPGPMRRLIDAYGYDERITLVQALIGSANGLRRFEVTDDAVSTDNAAVRALWATEGQYVGAVYVPMLTLHDLINQFGGFDFVNIDAEGGSVALFDKLLATPMVPRCICVEHDGDVVAVERMARKAGYQVAISNETNTVVYR